MSVNWRGILEQLSIALAFENEVIDRSSVVKEYRVGSNILAAKKASYYVALISLLVLAKVN